jgi:hypothetical protein
MDCLQCTSESVLHENKIKSGQIVDGTEGPPVNEAVTMAPAWQQQNIGGQMIMACVTVPACRMHIQVAEMSPVEQAVRNGRILPGGRG